MGSRWRKTQESSNCLRGGQRADIVPCATVRLSCTKRTSYSKPLKALTGDAGPKTGSQHEESIKNLLQQEGQRGTSRFAGIEHFHTKDWVDASNVLLRMRKTPPISWWGFLASEGSRGYPHIHANRMPLRTTPPGLSGLATITIARLQLTTDNRSKVLRLFQNGQVILCHEAEIRHLTQEMQ